jgi:hypothetical protein
MFVLGRGHWRLRVWVWRLMLVVAIVVGVLVGLLLF